VRGSPFSAISCKRNSNSANWLWRKTVSLIFSRYLPSRNSLVALSFVVLRVLEKALELVPEKRSAFLDRPCASDRSSRQEVDALLASGDEARSSFLQSSTLRVTLTAGTKLGEYEVKSLLGAGGMGEMYRARDVRLGRDVAIKVLPSFLSADVERLRRFEQEARAAAARGI